MSRFPFFLPADIVCEIFSFLEQEDCIQCMRVCHRWHLEIPHYTTEQWERIVIAPFGLNRTNDCMLHCLGEHTQDVLIADMSTVTPILNKLKEANCVIRTLDISSCPIDDETEFLSTIKQFSNTLADLSLYHLESDIPVSQLLGQFPNLMHLALEFDSDLRVYVSDSVNADTYSESNPSNLTSLHLDASLHFEDRIVPILRCCPNLTSLDFTPTMSKRLPVDALARIFQLCPNISYFRWNDATPSNYHEVSGEGALQTFMYRGNIDTLSRLGPVLEKSEYTLKHLRLVNQLHDIAIESNVLPRLRFPCVKMLSLVDLDMSVAEWASFLSGFRDVESVGLFVFADRIPFNRFAEVICRWKNLQRLELGREDNRLSPVDIWSNIGILSNNSQLQLLDLQYVHLTNDGLLDICKIRSLKNLYLWISLESPVNLEGLLEFADRLKSVDGIKDMELGHFKDLDDSVLERFANVKSLTWLSVVCNDIITTSGIKAFISNDSIGSAPRTAHILSCKHIDRVQWSASSF